MNITCACRVVMFAVVLAIALQTQAFCVMPSDADARELAEQGQVLLDRIKAIDASVDAVVEKIRSENKGEKSLSKRLVGSMSVMLSLGYARTAMSFMVSVYKVEELCMNISILEKSDFVVSSHVKDVVGAMSYAEKLLEHVQYELIWLDGRDCHDDIKPILENIQAINKDWPPNTLEKYNSSATAIEGNLTKPFQMFVVQSNSFTNDIYAYSVALGKAMQQYDSDIPNLVSVMDVFWGCQMALNKVAECVEWASICNLTHTHSSMAGFGEMNEKAMNKLASGVRSVTIWKNIFAERSAEKDSFLKPSDAERYTRAFDAWRKALVEALASDGLALPEVAGK